MKLEVNESDYKFKLFLVTSNKLKVDNKMDWIVKIAKYLH